MCSSAELIEKATKLPIETIIYVSDEKFRPYILLKDIDDKPYWRPYGGESIENVRKFHEWELNAQKQYKDKLRSTEEIDYLRNALMSVTFVIKFFSLDDETQQSMMCGVLEKTAVAWYCKDIGSKPENIDTEKDNEKLQPYLSLAGFYISSFFDTIQQVAVRNS